MIQAHAADVISYTEIIDIGPNGFSYGDSRVDFMECQKELGHNLVGWREAVGEKPYFEFAGKHHVVVTFDKKWGWRKRFHEFAKKLKAFGWRTFDLS